MLTGRTDKFVGDHAFETQVTDIEVATVESLLRNGSNVVIDDTNLRLKHARAWIELANRLGAESDVVNLKPPLNEVLERNRARIDAVPESVILDQARRFPYKNWEPVLLPAMQAHVEAQYVPNPSLPPCVTCDLDNTLADNSERNPFDTSRYMEDTLNEPLAEVLSYLKPHVRIGIVTGRSEEFRDVVEQWLDENGVEYDFLLMRAAGDARKDALIKQELFRDHVFPHYRHVLAFDDREQVVQGLRSIGVLVAQVADGRF